MENPKTVLEVLDDEENLIPEPGDRVEFTASGDYGIVSGFGTIEKVFKSGQALIERQGKRYKTDDFEILSKAG